MITRTLGRFIRPYRVRLLLLAALAMISSAILLTLPWLGGELMGELINRTTGAGWLLLVLSLALVGYTGLSIATSLISAATYARLLADLRSRVFDHVIRLPLSFHDQHRKGDTLALATSEITRLNRFLTGPLVTLPARLLTAIGASILLFRIDPTLALIVPIAVPVFYLALKIVGRRLRGLGVAIQKADAEVLGRVDETLDMLPMIKIFTRENLEHATYQRTIDHAAALQLRQARIYALLDPVISLVAGLFLIILLYMAGQRVGAGEMTRSELFSFMFYTALLTRPIGSLAHIYGEVQTARGSLLKLERLLRRPLETQCRGSVPSIPWGSSVSFRNVSFRYPGREPVLSQVNLEIAAGETVALVGPNGAGKTTLVHLLCGFYQPDSGAIYLGKIDIATVPVSDLRRQIALVPQRAMLLNASVRDNIMFGNPQATSVQLEKAISIAQADGFIDQLPHGLDTMIGDRGVRLSGGQRQRVALARALINEPRILILDEATSMFDTDAEDEFIQVSDAAFANRTVMMITHRPAILKKANQIISVTGPKALQTPAANKGTLAR